MWLPWGLNKRINVKTSQKDNKQCLVWFLTLSCAVSQPRSVLQCPAESRFVQLCPNVSRHVQQCPAVSRQVESYPVPGIVSKLADASSSYQKPIQIQYRTKILRTIQPHIAPSQNTLDSGHYQEESLFYFQGKIQRHCLTNKQKLIFRALLKVKKKHWGPKRLVVSDKKPISFLQLMIQIQLSGLMCSASWGLCCVLKI